MRDKPLSDTDLAAIEERNNARLQYRRDMSGGTWEYDSLGFIDSVEQPRAKRMGILVRRREWFDQFDLDAGLKKADDQAGIDGQYIAAVLTDNPERDIAQLLAEVRRFLKAR